ncbi:helix-hairpin-helix domain-containing protein [Streptomyces sp. NPDC052043]|uniref:helix-hairpin-helix domain-containing protein n=1 Tax=Streptomyces sp. NPDC052043 TaxID=3365684 RepID=UPI0037D83110
MGEGARAGAGAGAGFGRVGASEPGPSDAGPLAVGGTRPTGAADGGLGVVEGRTGAAGVAVRAAAVDTGGGVEAGLVDPAGVPDWRERAGAAVRERMPLWLQSRCGLERRNVVALTVLFVVAALFAVQHFWTGRTQTVQAPEAVRAMAPHEDGGQDKATAAGAPVTARGAPASPGAEIVVDVSGKVRRPGIQRLPAGSRVADALQAAGGVRSGTSTDGLNRARFLVDGEQVVVGGPAPAPAAAPDGPGPGSPVGAAGTGAAGTPRAPVSLNTASADQLQTLPGVGPVLAGRIVDYRTQHGGFRSVDQLREVSGIGTRRFADLRDLVSP